MFVLVATAVLGIISYIQQKIKSISVCSDRDGFFRQYTENDEFCVDRADSSRHKTSIGASIAVDVVERSLPFEMIFHFL